MELMERDIAAEEDLREVAWLVRLQKKKKKILYSALIFGLIALTVVISLVYASNMAKNNKELKDRIHDLENMPIVVNPVAPEINLDILYSEINDIAEMATMEYLFTDAAKFSDSKQIKNWNIPFTEKSFMLKWDGVIKAGVELDKVIIDVDEVNKEITITVPEAKILSYEVEDDSVEVLDEKNNIFNNITVDDKIKFDEKTEEAMKERAIENGILEKAQQNAEVILSGLITANSAVGDSYTLIFVVADK